ncbi:hypothetical protein BCD93_003828 [Clostridium saccharoperbutylacetonicum]|nr:hypothetical protein [Clostridium saccharoperbutylacetonicum]
MINKIIHYCWFGKGEKSELVKNCIKSWKYHLPDYEIIEWNEENYNINNNVYTKEAYKHKKWAFVSDYVRLYALYNHGGIYLDTDVEITKSLDSFLKYPAFMGFHNKDTLLTAVIGSKIQSSFIKELLSLYDNKHFVSNGKMDMQINNELITKCFVNNYNLNLNNKNQILKEEIYIFSQAYFSKAEQGYENYSIHHGEGSWYTLEKAMKELKAYKEYYLCLLNLFDSQVNGKRLKSKFSTGNFAIYGNGEMGHIAVEILKAHNINPICIIDKNNNHDLYNNIPIINLDDIKMYNINHIIITPIIYLQQIIDDIRNKDSTINLISISDIYEVAR